MNATDFIAAGDNQLYMFNCCAHKSFALRNSTFQAHLITTEDQLRAPRLGIFPKRHNMVVSGSRLCVNPRQCGSHNVKKSCLARFPR